MNNILQRIKALEASLLYATSIQEAQRILDRIYALEVQLIEVPVTA